jgi:transcriptional regulator with XRE-family HTH domain
MAATTMTNAEAAELLGLNHSTVSRMRKGERIGSLTTLRRIAEKFEIPIEQVLDAAQKAHAGDKSDWVRLIERALVAADPN